MNKKHVLFHYAVLITSLLLSCSIQSVTYGTLTSEATNTTPKQALKQSSQRFKDAAFVGEALFNPTDETTKKPNPFPTASSNESFVEALFGPSGINVDSTLLKDIKIFYFYLEYTARLEVAGRLLSYAKKSGIDFLTALNKNDWKSIVDQATEKAGSTTKLFTALQTVTDPDYTNIAGSIKTKTWLGITQTSFWKNVPVSSQEIINSSVWQELLKYSVTRSFVKDLSLLQQILDIEKQTFQYIPNIEVMYYNTNYTILRHSSEYYRLTLVLTDIIRNRHISQINDWKTITKSGSSDIDLVGVYNKSIEYEDTPLYQVASLANQGLNAIAEQISNKDLKFPKKQGTESPILQEILICLSMLKNIEARLFTYIKSTHLEQTMKTIKNSAIKKPAPNILFYTTDEHVLLNDLALVLDEFEKIAATNTGINTPTKNDTAQVQAIFTSTDDDEMVTTQGFLQTVGKGFEDLGKGIVKEGKQFVSDAEKTGKDIVKFGSDFGKGVIAEGGAAWDTMKAVGALVTGNPKEAGKLMKEAGKLQEKITEYMNKAYIDTLTVFEDTVNLTKDSANFGGTLLGGTIGALTGDEKLGDDISGMINAISAEAIDWTANSFVLPIELIGTAIVLTAEVASGIASIIATGLGDAMQGKWSQIGADMGDAALSTLASVGATLLSTITFTVGRFVEELMDIVKMVAYLIAGITELFLDIVTSTISALGTDLSLFGVNDQWSQDANTWLWNHQKTISAVATTVLLVVAVVATDGAGLPMIAMTAGPNMTSVVSGWQADDAAAKKKKEQKEFLSDFKTFVDNSEVIAPQEEAAWENELNAKFSSQITNQERELGFYQNFLNEYFDGTKDQMSFYLGQYLDPYITPDKKYGLRYLDVGALYGFKTGDGEQTGILNLNPSQGFPLYNEARDSFSQEIAVYPALVLNDNSSKNSSSSIPTKFWFNQKDTIPLSQTTSSVEIRFKPLYVLNIFYIGLYFGGDPIDLSKMKSSGTADIDSGHLAKMLVFKKEDKDKNPTLGLYEHEGQGWFSQSITNNPQFQLGSWYRMKMQLNNTQLQIKVWPENSTEPGWQTVMVKPTEQKTMGVIYSGASIEYQVVSPEIKKTAVPKYRVPINVTTEKNRESLAKARIDALEQPGIGTYNLKVPSKIQPLKGQYLYTSQATGLKDESGKTIDDYLIFGWKGSTVEMQGTSPLTPIKVEQGNVLAKSSSLRLVSLLSGNAYDKNIKKEEVYADAFSAYTKKYGPLTDTLQKTISAANKQFMQALMGPFNFGQIALTATSETDIQNGQFVYWAISPTKELVDKNGKPYTDSSGKPIYDYFTMVSDGTAGQEYSTFIDSIISLVTGNKYNRNSTTPVSGGWAISSVTDGLSSGLKARISAAKKQYNKEVQEEQALKVKKAQDANMGDSSGSYTSSTKTSDPDASADTPQGSVEQRSEQASDDQTSFGGGFGGGF